jgi:hypothetical protein
MSTHGYHHRQLLIHVHYQRSHAVFNIYGHMSTEELWLDAETNLVESTIKTADQKIKYVHTVFLKFCKFMSLSLDMISQSIISVVFLYLIF